MVGALRFANNLPANVEFSFAALDFPGVGAVVDFAGGVVAAVVGVVAEAVLGAAILGVGELDPLSNGGVILWTNPTYMSPRKVPAVTTISETENTRCLSAVRRRN